MGIEIQAYELPIQDLENKKMDMRGEINAYRGA